LLDRVGLPGLQRYPGRPKLSPRTLDPWSGTESTDSLESQLEKRASRDDPAVPAEPGSIAQLGAGELERPLCAAVDLQRRLEQAIGTIVRRQERFRTTNHELSADWNTPLDDRYPSLAELFTNAGYASGAFVSNYVYTMPESGLGRGFIRYGAFRVTPAEIVASSSITRWLADMHWVRRIVGSQDILNRKRADNVREEFLKWKDGLGGRPFFAMLNIFDAHEPYLPRVPYDTLFGDGRISFDPKTKFTQRSVALGEADRKRLSAEEQVHQHNAYDGALRSIDDQLSLLIDALRQRGNLDDIIVVITSDHGEGFGEGGEFMHGNLFADLTTHVPLLVRFPRVVPAGRVIPEDVSLRDLPATLIALAGLEVRADTLPGHSLVELLRSESAGGSGLSPAFSSFWAWRKTGARNWSMVRSGLRYLLSDKGKPSLFDLRSDPFETVNLLPRANPGLADSARAFRSIIDSIRAVTTTSPRPDPWKPSR